jgi:hypothetical protein
MKSDSVRGRVTAAAAAVALLTPGLLLVSARADAGPAVTRYRSCQQLLADYPHGVGLPRARDWTPPTAGRAPVTAFARSKSAYLANAGRDRDGDGVACERP